MSIQLDLSKAHAWYRPEGADTGGCFHIHRFLIYMHILIYIYMYIYLYMENIRAIQVDFYMYRAAGGRAIIVIVGRRIVHYASIILCKL